MGALGLGELRQLWGLGLGSKVFRFLSRAPLKGLGFRVLFGFMVEARKLEHQHPNAREVKYRGS